MKLALILSTFILTLIPSVSAANTISADQKRPIYPKALRELLYQTIDDNISWGDPDYEADGGSIWLGEIDKADMNIVGPIKKGPSGLLTMETYSEFICGTEYDESELYGTCEITLIRKSTWQVSDVTNCNCE